MPLSWKCLEYLTGSALTNESADKLQLLQNILDRRDAIVIASICVSTAAIVAALVTHSIWPIAWMLFDLLLSAARLSLMSYAQAGEGAVRRRCGELLSVLTLLWSASFGIAMLLLVQSTDLGLLVMACVLTVSVSSAITYRNAAMPRTAMVAISLTTIPFFLGIGSTLPDHKWIALVTCVPLLASLYSLTLQNHRILVRLITAERQAKALAHTDPLTGLPNRLSFVRHQTSILGHPRRKGGYAYMCLDLDGFKQINDSHGHPAGDLLLKAVAERLRANVRSEDVSFRIGGDEFIVYMPDATVSECSLVAARLIERMATPFDVADGVRVAIGCSAGSACFSPQTADATAILKAADEALYKAKLAGKSRHVHAA